MSRLTNDTKRDWGFNLINSVISSYVIDNFHDINIITQKYTF